MYLHFFENLFFPLQFFSHCCQLEFNVSVSSSSVFSIFIWNKVFLSCILSGLILSFFSVFLYPAQTDFLENLFDIFASKLNVISQPTITWLLPVFIMWKTVTFLMMHFLSGIIKSVSLCCFNWVFSIYFIMYTWFLCYPTCLWNFLTVCRYHSSPLLQTVLRTILLFSLPALTLFKVFSKESVYT